MTSEKFRIPVVSTPEQVEIPWSTLKAIISGNSVLELNSLHIKNKQDAFKFLQTYGFDLKCSKDRSFVKNIQGAGLRLLSDTLLPYQNISKIPDKYREMSPSELLIEASQNFNQNWPNWPCIILKVYHCAAHALLTHDSKVHELAITKLSKRFLPYLTEKDSGLWFGDSDCEIPLVTYQIKKEKDVSRIMLKLLRKPGNLANLVYDHVGIRFVTHDIYSAILLIKFLRSRHVISYVNVLPELSKNSLSDLEQVQSMYEKSGSPFVERKNNDVAQSVHNENPFSSGSYQMIKFVERLLVNLDGGNRIFFPYEIQILDKNAWESSHTDDCTHDRYEKRQLLSVQQRLFRNPERIKPMSL